MLFFLACLFGSSLQLSPKVALYLLFWCQFGIKSILKRYILFVINYLSLGLGKIINMECYVTHLSCKNNIIIQWLVIISRWIAWSEWPFSSIKFAVCLIEQASPKTEDETTTVLPKLGIEPSADLANGYRFSVNPFDIRKNFNFD